MDKFDLKTFAEGNNVTYIELAEGDFVYVQLSEPRPDETLTREEVRRNAHRFFEWAFEGHKVKLGVEYAPLQITVLTKKEEFVARLGDDIVQL